MLLPSKIQRQSAGERFIAALEHGDGFEQLQIRVMITGDGEKLEVRNWTRGSGGQRVPSRHGFIALLDDVLPWLVQELSKLAKEKNLIKENSK